MTNAIPKISVVMPVYNAQKYLREAIESILNQTFRDFEFIIVNDGSSDASGQIIKTYEDSRIILISQTNAGIVRALNTGIYTAKAECIARMDADDISMPNRLELQYDFLQNHPECVAVGSNAAVIDQNGNYVYTSCQPLNCQAINQAVPTTPFFHSSTMYKKESFQRVGGYADFHSMEDVVFFNKLTKLGSLKNLPDVLIKYRLVPTAISLRSPVKKSKVINQITSKAINGTVTEEERRKLNRLIVKRDIIWKTANYYLHLAKKYLVNNYRSDLARINLRKSLTIKFRMISVFCYFASFIPERMLKRLYVILKNN